VELARHGDSPFQGHIHMDGAELFRAVMNAPRELGLKSDSEEGEGEDMVPDSTMLLDDAEADMYPSSRRNRDVRLSS
jgi:hypothetical protein